MVNGEWFLREDKRDVYERGIKELGVGGAFKVE